LGLFRLGRQADLGEKASMGWADVVVPMTFLWQAVQVSFGINIPFNKDELFSRWLRSNGPKTNTLLLAAAALIWAIWLTRNELFLKKLDPKLLCRY